MLPYRYLPFPYVTLKLPSVTLALPSLLLRYLSVTFCFLTLPQCYLLFPYATLALPSLVLPSLASLRLDALCLTLPYINFIEPRLKLQPNLPYLNQHKTALIDH